MSPCIQPSILSGLSAQGGCVSEDGVIPERTKLDQRTSRKLLLAVAKPLLRGVIWMIGGPRMMVRVQVWLRRYAAAIIAFLIARFFGFLLPFLLEIVVFLLALPLVELYLDGLRKRAEQSKPAPKAKTEPAKNEKRPASPSLSSQRRWLRKPR